MTAVYLFLAALYLLWLSFKRLSRAMERRADRVAATAQADEAVYARALERVHRVNLWPAVLPSNHSRTHPDLYDRLLAANFTPEYPRPSPPWL